MKRIWTVGVTVAAVTLVGCGGQSSSAPSSSAPASSAAAPAPTSPAPTSPAPAGSAASPASTSSASSPTGGGTTTASVQDPCKVISVAQMSKLVGVPMKSSRSSKLSTSRVCTYLPKTLNANAVSVTTQEGEFPGGSLDQGVQGVQKQLKAKSIKDVRVLGADDAKVIVGGKLVGVSVIDVFAGKDQVFYQALVGGRGDVSKYQDKMVRVAGALIKG